MGILTFALGILVGGLGGLFGIGGGLLAIPALGLIYGMDQPMAQGTSLVMIAPNVLLGFWKYRQRVRIDLRMAALLAVSAVLCTYVSARIATSLNATQLRLAFGAFLIGIAAFLAYQLIRRDRATEAGPIPALPWGWSWIVGAAGGMLSGIFGVGGATIAPPALTTFFGISQKAAQGLALALIAPSTVIALVAYNAAGEVNWAAGIPLAMGGLVSVSVGVALAHRLPERQLRLLFCGLLVVTAAMLMGHG